MDRTFARRGESPLETGLFRTRKMNVTRRSWLRSMASAAAAAALRPAGATAKEASFDGRQIADQTLDFIRRCAREDGSYAPSPDKDYKGNSDTGLSDHVHACFDAVFIVRQLGGGSERCQRAIERGARWSLSCRNADGGFGHFPGWHSDMDAVYFQFGTLVQAGLIPGARNDLADAHTLAWGHAMQPERTYEVAS